MRRLRSACRVLFAFLLLSGFLRYRLAWAGPPDPDTVRQLTRSGGGEETGTTFDWSGYQVLDAETPGYQLYASSVGNSWWPPDVRKPLQWLGENLNPGKWVVESLKGGVVLLGKNIVTAEAWIVLFFMGRAAEVSNAYDRKMEWDEASGEPPPDIEPVEVPGFRDLDPESWDESGDYIGRNVVVYTPAQMTWRNETVVALWRVVLLVSAGLLFLILAYGGIRVMAGGGAPGNQGAGEFLVRALGAGILSVLTLPVFGLALKLENLFAALAAPPNEEITMFLETMKAAQTSAAVLEAVVALGMFLLVLLLVVGIMMLRIGLLCFLLIAAPLALLAWIFPGSRGWWDRWSRMAWGAVILQPVLLLTLRVGMVLFNLPLSLVWGSGGGNEPGAIMAAARSGEIVWPHFIILVVEPLIGVTVMILCLFLTRALLLPEGGPVPSLIGLLPARIGAARAAVAAPQATGTGVGGVSEAATRGVGASPLLVAAGMAASGGTAGRMRAGDLGGATSQVPTIAGRGPEAASAAPSGTLDGRIHPRMPVSATASTPASWSRATVKQTLLDVGVETVQMTAQGIPPKVALVLAASKKLGLTPPGGGSLTMGPER